MAEMLTQVLLVSSSFLTDEVFCHCLDESSKRSWPKHFHLSSCIAKESSLEEELASN